MFSKWLIQRHLDVDVVIKIQIIQICPCIQLNTLWSEGLKMLKNKNYNTKKKFGKILMDTYVIEANTEAVFAKKKAKEISMHRIKHWFDWRI